MPEAHRSLSIHEYNPVVPPLRDAPFSFFAEARRTMPVFYSEMFQAFVVTRHSDVQAVLRDSARFSSRDQLKGASFPDEVVEVLKTGVPDAASIVDNDPPDHTRFRALLQKALPPRRFNERESFIREVANRLVDGLLSEGRADIIARFAYPLPALVIAEVLGIPHADIGNFKRWSDDWIGLLSEPSTEKRVGHARGMVEFRRYLADIIEDRKTSPRDDMLTDVVQANLKAESPATQPEMVSLVLQTLFAGHETTTGLIAGAVLHLLQDPEALRAVHEDPRLVAAAVEEAARMESPIWAMYRATTEDVELSGVRIPKGSRIQVVFLSASRDERRYPDPDRFDLRRAAPEDHLAYGKGIHFCMGAPLARLEGRVALEVLTARLRGVRLVADQSFARLPSVTVRRLERLYVEWDPA